MKHIIALFGLLVIITGVIGGAYLGIVYGLVGGVIAVIEAAKHTPVESAGVAWGIARVLFSGLMGWGTAAAGTFIGSLLIAFAGYGSRR